MSSDSYKIRTLGEYQRSVERFEKVNDGLVLPDMRLVIRIDARRYRSSTNRGSCEGSSWDDWDYPYAPEIVEALTISARKLMVMGLYVCMSVVHGDEISLLLDECEGFNPRKRSMLLSLVSSAGSIHFRENFPHPVIFHGVLSELPTERHVLDYFFWQRRCFMRNLLSQVLSRALGSKGWDPRKIEEKVNPLSLDERLSLADDHGCGISDMPDWMKYGIALWWEKCLPEFAETNSSEQGGEEVIPGDSSNHIIVQSRYLPQDDEDFLSFMRERLEGPSYLPDNSFDHVGYRELRPDERSAGSISKMLKPGIAPRSASSNTKNKINNCAVKGPFRIGGNARLGTEGSSKGRSLGHRSSNTTIIKSK